MAVAAFGFMIGGGTATVSQTLGQGQKNKSRGIFSCYTLVTIGFEALIRLKSNELYPNNFIPIAEEDGSIVAIGRWVVNAVVTRMCIGGNRV
jgi:EAL domain-containing protein (putative c-di-GMP-specific phosphodiesterase class I)